jgi:hypothetical protein
MVDKQLTHQHNEIVWYQEISVLHQTEIQGPKVTSRTDRNEEEEGEGEDRNMKVEICLFPGPKIKR